LENYLAYGARQNVSFIELLIYDYTGTTLYFNHSMEIIMGPADTYVRARIDTRTKELATEALEAMGLSVSDAIRLLMIRIAEEHRLPFTVKVPNATTRKAIKELETGKGKRTNTINDLMADLNADA
jgi:DNA-damage-inducible protein J